MPTNKLGNMLSGTTYVRAKPRETRGFRRDWFALIVRKVRNCDHGGTDADALPTICTWCAESWSWDYDLAFWRTVAGRRLAQEMNLDPVDAGQVLRYRDGYEQVVT